MTVRHAALPIGALLVLGVGVYLFIAVSAQPTTPEPPRRAQRASPAPPPEVSPPVAQHDAAARAPLPEAPARAPTPPPPPARPSLQDVDADVAGPKLDLQMAEANKAYDRGDFDDAKLIAARLLARYPTNPRMLRIMVSTLCIEGDGATALTHLVKLPPADQEQMKTRCARYGINFPPIVDGKAPADR